MSIARKTLRWLLLAPSILPLFFIDGFIFPYLAPKTLLLRGLGVLLLSLFVFVALSGEPLFWQRLRSKLSWIPAALLFVAYATSLVGLDFYRSFWSTYSRGDGLLTLSVIVLFFYATLLVADEELSKRFMKVVAWVSTLVALQALLQWVSSLSGVALPFIPFVVGRVEGTLGNPAFLACYLGLTVFITLALARTEKGGWQTFFYVSAGMQLLDIFFTATRGTIVALGVVLIAGLVYVALTQESTYKLYARRGLGVLLILAVLFIALRGPLSHIPIVWVERLASASPDDPTVSSRFFLWEHLTGEALAKPFTGYGAEHVDVVFNKVFDPTAIYEQWFDRSHNSYLDYVLQYGILGLLLYIGVIKALFYRGWQLFKTNDPYALVFMATAVVYGVQNFFVFDTAIIFWTLLILLALALVPRSERGQQKETEVVLVTGVPWKALGATMGVFLLYFVWPVTVEPWRANLALTEGYVDQVADVETGIAAMQAGFDLDTYADLDYGYELYAMYTGVQLNSLKGENLLAAYQFAETILEKNYNRYPYDARTALYLAHVLDSAPAGVAKNTQFLNEATDRSIELSPKRDQAWYIKANVPLALGDASKSTTQKNTFYKQAIDIIAEYAALVPNSSRPRYILASLYFTIGDKASAKSWAEEGLETYQKGDSGTAKRAAKYYINVEDWSHAEEFLDEVVAGDPGDFNSTYDLAKASFLAGDRNKALQLVQTLRQEKPGLVESDPAFLAALGQ